MSETCSERGRTLLWLYGESVEDMTAHVAVCDECFEVVDQHTAVTGAVAGWEPKKREEVLPSNRVGWVWLGGVTAIAAVVFLAVVNLGDDGQLKEEKPQGQERVVVAFGFDSEIDQELMALDSEIEDLTFDLSEM